MTLETELRLFLVVGMLIPVVMGVLILQARHNGRVNATARQTALKPLRE